MMMMMCGHYLSAQMNIVNDATTNDKTAAGERRSCCFVVANFSTSCCSLLSIVGRGAMHDSVVRAAAKLRAPSSLCCESCERSAEIGKKLLRSAPFSVWVEKWYLHYCQSRSATYSQQITS